MNNKNANKFDKIKFIKIIIPIIILLAVYFGANNGLSIPKPDSDTESYTYALNTDESNEKLTEYTETEYSESPKYKFRNSELLQNHFEKHGKEMGFASASDYEKAASAVAENSASLHKLEAEDGDDVYFLESTGEFVIISTDGYIRTYYIPEDGIEYFERQ